MDAVVTNNMPKSTHACITLGPSINLPGSVECFDFLTGKVGMHRSVDILPLTDCILKLVNFWGQMTGTLQYENSLKFLDRNRNQLDWDNEELIDTKGLVERKPRKFTPAFLKKSQE